LHSVCIKNVNPRNFYLITSSFREEGIPFRVPKRLGEDCGDFLIEIVDGGPASRIQEHRHGMRTRIAVPPNASEETLKDLLFRVKALLRGCVERPEKLVLGVDIGKHSCGVAVVASKNLIHSEVVSREGLLRVLEDYLKLDFKEIEVKIGVAPSNYTEAVSLAEEIKRVAKVKVVLVDETRTSAPNTIAKKGKLSTDESAAYAIALKEPFFVYK